MSLLCLSGSDVARVTSSLSPAALQALMAHVFQLLSASNSNSQTANPLAYTPHRTSIQMQNHLALFMPARIAQHYTLRGTSIKIVSIPSSPLDVRGLSASTLVLDEDTGAVRAIVNASKLTALRNAAGSLLSCNLVGPREPVNIAAFGAGAQIEAHLDLFLRAFPSIRTCTIVNRSLNDRALKLAESIRTHYPQIQTTSLANDATVSDPNSELQAALLSAHVVICATSSTVPLFPSAWVSDGAHVVLVGSYKPTMHEVDGSLIRRALARPGTLLVDSRASCAIEAGELIAAGIDGTELTEIGELVKFTGGTDGEPQLDLDWERQPLPVNTGRTAGPVTIFKSVGVGLQDVAIACAVVKQAEAMGIGQTVDWA